MFDLVRTFFEALMASQREGWADKFALWVFVVITLLCALWAIRSYQRAIRALEKQYIERIAALELRLDGCEGRHGSQEEESRALRYKLERLNILLLSLFGSDIPKPILELMLEPLQKPRLPASKENQGQSGPAASS